MGCPLEGWLRSFDSTLSDHTSFATVAQMVELLTCNEDVTGSNPVGGSTTIIIIWC